MEAGSPQQSRSRTGFEHLSWLGALFVLLAAAAIYFRPAWAGTVSFLVGDNLTHSLPLDLRLSDALHGGSWRFWDPDVAFGAPIYAEGTGGWFHPWKLLLFAVFPPLMAHDLLYISSFMLTGVSCLLVGAILSVRPSLALVGAITVTFSPTVLGNLNNEAYAHSVAWAGLWLLAFERWYSNPTVRRLAWHSLAIALAVVAGYPPMVYAQLLLFAPMLAIRLACDRRRRLAHAFGFPAAVVLGLGISAFQVLPLVELASHSVRQETVAPLNAFPWQNYLGGLVFANDPELYAPGRFQFFLAPLGTALGLLAVAFLPLLRGPIALSYLGGIALCVGAAGGPGSPVYSLLRVALPGFDRLRLLSPFLYVTIVPLGVLFSLLLEAAFRRRPSRGQAAACMGTLLAFVLLMAVSLPGRTASAEYLLKSVLVLALAGAGFVIPRLMGRPAWAPALWMAALLEVGMLKSSYMSYLPDSILSEGSEVVSFLSALQRIDREARGIHLSSARYDNTVNRLIIEHWKTPGYEALARATLRLQAPDANLPNHIAFAEANDALPLAGVHELREAMQAELRREDATPPGERMIDRYRVRWVVVLGDLGRTPVADGLQVVLRDPTGPVTVLENTGVQPRYRWQSARSGAEPSAPQPVAAWRRWIDALPWVAPESERAVEIAAPAPGVIFAAIPHYPGWTAWLDGEPFEPLRAADGVGIEVPVAAGPHRLELRFTPYAFHGGLLVAAASAFVLLALVVRGDRSDLSADRQSSGTEALRSGPS